MPEFIGMENAADAPDGANLEIVHLGGLYFNIEMQSFQF